MEKNKRDSLIATLGGSLGLLCLIGAWICDDTPSYEADYLTGPRYLLNWVLACYLPLFPLVSVILGVIISETKSKIGMVFSSSALNTVLTAAFAIFALSVDILATSWCLLTLGSLVFTLLALYDKRISQSTEHN